MRIIVSFTSYPPRINNVHKVVESLYQQTVQADEIVLYLSLDEFPGAEADIPGTLKSLIGRKGFRVKWVHGNLKSHKKYYYALQEYKDAVVITVDDDKIYAGTMISDLVKSYKRFPNAVSTRLARIMFKKIDTLQPYSKWEDATYLEKYTNVPRMDLCAIGAGGICYSPSLVNEDWFDEEKIVKVAENQDDLWLKYNEIISNIPVVCTRPSQEDVTIENSQVCRLSADNLHGNGNDKCIHKLLVLLKEQNVNRYQAWLHNLMTWEEYITERKRYYADVLRVALDKVKDMPVYVYGAGKTAQIFLKFLVDFGLIQRVTAIIVSDKSENPPSLYGLQVKSLEEVDTNRGVGMIFGVDGINKKEIMNRLQGYNYKSIELDMRIIMRYC